MTKNDIIETLVKISCAGNDESYTHILASVLEREKQGSTFFNEAVAFPHARIDIIAAPIIAFGITKQGVSDVQTDKPIECVFLILTPGRDASAHVQILGLAAEAARNRHLLQMLKTAQTHDDILSMIKDCELMQACKP